MKAVKGLEDAKELAHETGKLAVDKLVDGKDATGALCSDVRPALRSLLPLRRAEQLH